ncbi:MAG: acetate uptake transporter [Trichloromonas sp.]|nr:acetate uptake transporter [Trichloromonas sp.]
MGCPFYGKNEDLCDVGCGYISPHDAKIISQFCSTQPEDCPRYQYLMEREAEPAIRPAAAAPTPLPEPGETSPGRTPKPVAPKPSRPLPARPFSTLPPLGLICFGLTTLIFSLRLTELLPLPEWFFKFAILAGGLGQFTVGILEWVKKRYFSAVALGAYGFFWLSLPLLLPAAGAARAPALTAYLLLWCLFGAVLLVASLQINRDLPWVFGSSSLLLFLLAAGHVTGYRPLEIAALLTGFVCAATALRALRGTSAAMVAKIPSQSPFTSRPTSLRRH